MCERGETASEYAARVRKERNEACRQLAVIFEIFDLDPEVGFDRLCEHINSVGNAAIETIQLREAERDTADEKAADQQARADAAVIHRSAAEQRAKKALAFAVTVRERYEPERFDRKDGTPGWACKGCGNWNGRAEDIEHMEGCLYAAACAVLADTPESARRVPTRGDIQKYVSRLYDSYSPPAHPLFKPAIDALAEVLEYIDGGAVAPRLMETDAFEPNEPRRALVPEKREVRPAPPQPREPADPMCLDPLPEALQTARAKVEDGRTVLGIADAAWRKGNPPKPDPPDSLGLTQQRRMAWKGGFVYGWIACLAELGVEIKGDDQE